MFDTNNKVIYICKIHKNVLQVKKIVLFFMYINTCIIIDLLFIFEWNLIPFLLLNYLIPFLSLQVHIVAHFKNINKSLFENFLYIQYFIFKFLCNL